MKSYILILFQLFPLCLFAQLEPGFKKEEARDMIAICNSFTFLELFDSDEIIIPEGYQKQYTSPVLGMDNMYQIYTNGKTAVINFRGSTCKKISWLENIYSAMIPATGKMEVSGKKFKYCFAKNEDAAVHAGYSLAIAFLSEDLMRQIKLLNKKGIHSFIITGHSQGGALANMSRAYLENLSRWKIRKKNEFKTYAYAAPMIGNKQFSEEYNQRFSSGQTSFNIVNPSDPIPKLPFSYCDTNYVSSNLRTFLFANETFSMKKMISDGISLILEKSTNSLCSQVSKQIAKEVGPFKMPGYLKEINYYSLNNRIEIPPAVFPKTLKDSFQSKIIMALSNKDSESGLANKLLYEKESWTFQHKPYNYFTTILKIHFPVEYETLKSKYLLNTGK